MTQINISKQWIDTYFGIYVAFQTKTALKVLCHMHPVWISIGVTGIN